MNYKNVLYTKCRVMSSYSKDFIFYDINVIMRIVKIEINEK